MTDKEENAINQIFILQTDYINPEIDASIIGEKIMQMSIDELMQYVISKKAELPTVTTKNIPQFSNINDVTKVLWILADSGINDLDYGKIGLYMCPDNSTEGACRKYGENHYKLAAQLGLVTENKPFAITDLGFLFYSLKEDERKRLLQRLVLRIPIVQQLILDAQIGIVSVREKLGEWLSPSTVIRRSSNVFSLVSLMRVGAGEWSNQVLTNIMR